MTDAERRGSQRVTISDPRVMRALAHPARLAIMEHLGSTGESVTATSCAEVAGLSPSATSYHLRALAKAGLVEAAPSRGDGRERLWRAVAPSFSIDAGRDASDDTRAAEIALVDTHLQRDFERIRTYARTAHLFPPEWYNVGQLSSIVCTMTPDEALKVNQAIMDLIDPYRRRNRADPPSESRTVVIHYAATPQDVTD
ncbi:DNA-binding transcriptional ArsR family regulator [Catenuloplanes nepalensis]|uniref:DNA-binding transcriptional ArsR family regulator n=1 Tax=Catenuloplanes nepalensis TaxID=587533 RepID=A0ABT9N585_9ACTN|nr:metalloregulator ArsR/SmtB family transcription factor [Catenuloplanes nepalensis]MDP9798848.1 DNA-binding transcriptional ArsR family regulator [Catenuloplanes nepalensis]